MFGQRKLTRAMRVMIVCLDVHDDDEDNDNDDDDHDGGDGDDSC
jgi:hypothetical protein